MLDLNKLIDRAHAEAEARQGEADHAVCIADREGEMHFAQAAAEDREILGLLQRLRDYEIRKAKPAPGAEEIPPRILVCFSAYEAGAGDCLSSDRKLFSLQAVELQDFVRDLALSQTKVGRVARETLDEIFRLQMVSLRDYLLESSE